MKYTQTQKDQLKALRAVIRKENKYKPRGQGDSINQHLKMRNLGWLVDQIKKGEDVTHDLRMNGIHF